MPDTFPTLFTTRQTARQAGDSAVVLETLSFEVHAPFGGFVWNRPAAVRVRGPAAETRLPIIDLTRRGQIVLYTIALFFMLAGLAARGRAHQE